ncbi:MAG: ABC transporter ATP-binding protein/permease [Streptococcaceae bacterium]|jgi:ATP-binding cassette subfamily B protein|nr:ABC transporter ATP-binding protein/permease [Streptococcaceae bacterium]
MKNQKTYLFKITFIFKEIFKAGPWVLFFSLGTMIINGISPIITTYTTFEIIKILEHKHNNEVITQDAYNHLFFILIIMLFGIVLNFSAENIKKIVCQITGYKLSHNIETMIAGKFQKINQEIMDTPIFLDSYKNALDQASYEPLNIMESLFSVVSTTISSVGYMVILMKWKASALFLLVVFALPVLYYKQKTGGKLYKYLISKTMQLRQIWYYFSLISTPKYAKEIRIFNLFDYLKKIRKNSFENFFKGNIKIAREETIYIILTYFFAIFGVGVVMYWLIKAIIFGLVSVSKFILYNTAIVSFEMGLLALVDLVASNNKSMLFLNYLFNFLEIKEEIVESPKKVLISQIVSTVEFVDVSFKYPGANNYALKNVNLKFKTCEKLCLVGENGSGKSTFVKLLLGIYKPLNGKIFLNGVNIKNYNPADYKKLFGVCFQDYLCYLMNVKKNIGFGDINNIDNLTHIKKIAKKTRSNEFIQTYKYGYDTNLGKDFYEDAIEPSIGQWQKLAISRTLFSDAPILILDEPTASLDPKTEEEFFKIFKEGGKNKILIIISHRMCSAKLADIIVLFDQGEIVELGTHKKLMHLGGKYYEMYTLQAEKYVSVD